jgi:hypothetical protein
MRRRPGPPSLHRALRPELRTRSVDAGINDRDRHPLADRCRPDIPRSGHVQHIVERCFDSLGRDLGKDVRRALLQVILEVHNSFRRKLALKYLELTLHVVALLLARLSCRRGAGLNRNVAPSPIGDDRMDRAHLNRERGVQSRLGRKFHLVAMLRHCNPQVQRRPTIYTP